LRKHNRAHHSPALPKNAPHRRRPPWADDATAAATHMKPAKAESPIISETSDTSWREVTTLTGSASYTSRSGGPVESNQPICLDLVKGLSRSKSLRSAATFGVVAGHLPPIDPYRPKLPKWSSASAFPGIRHQRAFPVGPTRYCPLAGTGPRPAHLRPLKHRIKGAALSSMRPSP